jgi:hypothetical protein
LRTKHPFGAALNWRVWIRVRVAILKRVNSKRKRTTSARGDRGRIHGGCEFLRHAGRHPVRPHRCGIHPDGVPDQRAPGGDQESRGNVAREALPGPVGNKYRTTRTESAHDTSLQGTAQHARCGSRSSVDVRRWLRDPPDDAEAAFRAICPRPSPL